jgi:glycosyltransferase involved in cell wall biosynthesis
MSRVLVLANNLQQASYRVRVEALIPLLAARGHALDVQIRPRNWLARRRLLRSAADYDAVLLQRKLLDPSDARLLKRSARGLIFYDVDDAVMYHNRRASWISRWRTSRRFRATARAIDHAVAGNEYLADIFRKEGKPVTVVPTVVDPARYLIKSHGETSSPRLVWIGSRSTLPYLRQFVPAIEQAAKQVPGLGLVTIADDAITDAKFPVEHIPWSADGEAAALCRGDIGIAPTPTDRWTLGKCGFKIVQYMAAGLPVIASPVGANAELVKEGESGLLPQSTEAWTEAIVGLAKDAAARARMGEAGRRAV